MRVSKTVREYITGRVAQKLDIKYKPLMEERRRADEALMTLQERIARSMADLGEIQMAEAIADNPELVRTSKDLYLTLKREMYSIIRREAPGKSPYQQREDEKEEIVRNIIVTLELGGTKADLERMLAEIAVEG